VPIGRNFKRGLDSGEIRLVETSGSSDISVTNIWNQEWWDASERASWELNSHATRLATGNHPEAILANPLNVGVVSNDVDLPMEKRLLARFLYLNEKADPTKLTMAAEPMAKKMAMRGDHPAASMSTAKTAPRRNRARAQTIRKKAYRRHWGRLLERAVSAKAQRALRKKLNIPFRQLKRLLKN
jgi:hypothetical protein